jgi:hypothetical protein
MAKPSKNRSRQQQAQARARAAAARSQSSAPAPASKSAPKARGPANRARRLAPPARAGGTVRSGIRSGLGRPIAIAVVAVVLIGGYFGYQWWQSRKPPAPITFASPSASTSPVPDLAGLQTGGPPWDAALGTLRERLGQIGLPVLSTEVVEQHFHLHLDVVVNGHAVTVPDDIGRNEGGGYLTVIHTHTGDGVIHIEAPKGPVYTLGQLFDVWGVRFSGTCLGGLCNEGDRIVRVYADGELLNRDPRLLILGFHQEIVVSYGTASQVPEPVPSRYSFPFGT